MTDSTNPSDAAQPHRFGIPRRRLLKLGGVTGLAAGLAITGVAQGASDTTGAPATPDSPDAFGVPPSQATLHSQRTRAKALKANGIAFANSITAGADAQPQPVAVPGAARLRPARAAIDHTPLARRTSDAPWPVEG